VVLTLGTDRVSLIIHSFAKCVVVYKSVHGLSTSTYCHAQLAYKQRTIIVYFTPMYTAVCGTELSCLRHSLYTSQRHNEFYLSVRPSVRLLPILWTQRFESEKTDFVVVRIGTSGPRGKGMKQPTFGVKCKGHKTPKLDLETWRRHHSRSLRSSRFSSTATVYNIGIKTYRLIKLIRIYRKPQG